MATFTDPSKTSAAEATQAAQESIKRYLDESSTVGRAYWNAWTATTQAGLRSAFEVQNAGVQATRAMWDSLTQVNRTWLDQAAEQMRKTQDATAKLVAAGVTLADSGTSSNGRA